MFKKGYLILTLLLISCNNSNINDQNQSNDNIFFEVEYINYAWGFSYQGMMIDQDGSIYSYNPAKDSIPVLYNSDGYYTEQELRSKYGHGQIYRSKVSEDTVKWSHDLATQVTMNNFSDTTRVGADMGNLLYSVYIYRLHNSKYQQVLLRLEGNPAFYNKSESAITLVTWLKKL